VAADCIDLIVLQHIMQSITVHADRVIDYWTHSAPPQLAAFTAAPGLQLQGKTFIYLLLKSYTGYNIKREKLKYTKERQNKKKYISLNTNTPFIYLYFANSSGSLISIK